MVAMISCVHLDDRGDDLRCFFQFNYKLTPTTLGKGSFSKVVLANHVILNKQVALKVVTLHKIKDPYVSKNLKREAAIMAKLNHPNIVSLHEVVFVIYFY